ncbi:MAG: anaerobic ribonucleoside-triphosphate reductase activating protein [Paludibacteraceae bacterium]|nr:anaerobic ribonucleoside-triphosphate reductase activating protein [Paludibacteraceae bacterium]
MLRFVNYSVVFQEVPDEVTLAINISGCPNKCKGCHSPYLMENTGDILNNEVLAGLLNRYKHAITCVCFMGGDSEPKAIEGLSFFIRESTDNQIKTAWYSGKQRLPENCSLENFDYIKLGSYIEELGGLDSPSTNQHFYKIKDGRMIDKTELFTKK